jgi:bacteriocin-like protein
MHEPQELTDNELDSVSGGNRSDAPTGASDAASDFLKWLLDRLHVPAKSGGPIL